MLLLLRKWKTNKAAKIYNATEGQKREKKNMFTKY